MGTHEHHHQDAVSQAGMGMDGTQLPQPEATEHERRRDVDGPTELASGSIPVHGDEDTADELAMEAYGDEDEDGNPDIPNAPFPG
ncbi:MAG: hypothetical protein L0J68_00105 [Micrococcaceae bacterium]|nr:hypothetical protein [Micrococcaceae bacterium]